MTHRQIIRLTSFAHVFTVSRSVFFTGEPNESDLRCVSSNCAVLQQKNRRTVEATVNVLVLSLACACVESIGRAAAMFKAVEGEEFLPP